MSVKGVIPVITIDGPSGTGKGTICALLAQRLGWHCLDSGSIYRVLALSVQACGIALEDETNLVRQAHELDVLFLDDGRVFLNAQDVTLATRSEQCGQMASRLGALYPIRQALLKRQRDFRQSPGLVTDGRDMGTVIFPDAALKFYLTASVAARADRRYLQLKAQGICVSLAQVLSELAVRDERDSARAFSPLQSAEDALVLDTTAYSVNEVFENVLQTVKEKGLLERQQRGGDDSPRD